MASETLSGAELIAAERQRQVSEEGWTPEHDDRHDKGELGRAAVTYILYSCGPFIQNYWPWDWSWFKAENTTQGSVRNLVKAGALIAAEIDRLQRAAATTTNPAAGPAEEGG